MGHGGNGQSASSTQQPSEASHVSAPFSCAPAICHDKSFPQIASVPSVQVLEWRHVEQTQPPYILEPSLRMQAKPHRTTWTDPQICKQNVFSWATDMVRMFVMQHYQAKKKKLIQPQRLLFRLFPPKHNLWFQSIFLYHEITDQWTTFLFIGIVASSLYMSLLWTWKKWVSSQD